MSNLMIQGIGFLSAITSIGEFWFKKRNTILLCDAVTNLLSIIYFSAIGCNSVAMLSIVSIFRGIVYRDELKSKDKANLFYFLFSILYFIIIIIFESRLELIVISMISIQTYNYSMWNSNISKMKRYAIVASFVWMLYDILVGAYMDIFQEIIYTLSTYISNKR